MSFFRNPFTSNQTRPGPQVYVDSNPLSLGLKVWSDEGSPIADLVFIHGLGGHRDKTWTRIEESTPWPVKILPGLMSTSKLDRIRLMTFGYQAACLTSMGKQVSMDNLLGHAIKLLTCLVGERREVGDRPIIFVCHSLGGLLCKEALCYSNGVGPKDKELRTIYESTRRIMFFGTPHLGADSANTAAIMLRCLSPLMITGNRKNLDILCPDSALLERLSSAFDSLLEKRVEDRLPDIKIRCFYETYELALIQKLVVSKQSARFGNYLPVSIDANHIDMVKFIDANDPGFKSFLTALQLWMGELSSEIVELRIAEERRLREIVELRLAEERKAREIAEQRMAEERENRRLLLEQASQVLLKSLFVPQQKDLFTEGLSCGWLLQDSDYLAWKEPKPSGLQEFTLIVKGKPGAGKSVGLKLAADKLKSESLSSKTSNITLSHFFDARRDTDHDLTRSPKGMYRMLLHGLIEQAKPHLFEYIAQGNKEIGPDYAWSTSELLEELHTIMRDHLPEHTVIFMFIDAFDEIRTGRDESPSRILKDLHKLASSVKNAGRLLQICISTQHTRATELEQYFDTNGGGCRSIVAEEKNHIDINLAIERRLRWKLPESFEQVGKLMGRKASGCFLWVALVLNDLEATTLTQTNDYLEIVDIVNNKPNDLTELYKRLLNPSDLVEMQRTKQCCKFLQLLLVAQEPLGVEEVGAALFICSLGQDEEFSWEAFKRSGSSEENISKQVVGITGGLVQIESTKLTADDKSSTTVRRTVTFMHETVKQYVQNSQIGSRHDPQHEFDAIAHSHYTWTQLCFKVMNARDPEESAQHALLQYTYKFWMSHVREAEKFEGRDHTYPRPVAHCSWRSGLFVREYTSTVHTNPRQNALELYDEEELLVCLAAEGCASLVETHLRRCSTCNGQLEKPLGQSQILNRALYLACTHNRPEVVEVFRRYDRDGNVVVKGHSALYQACFYGNVTIVKHLLSMGARPDVEGDQAYWGLPLHAAVIGEHKEVVETLFNNRAGSEREWLLRLRNQMGATALHMAVVRNRKDMAAYLLEMAADRSALAGMKVEGRDALALAEYHRHHDMVNLIHNTTSS